MKLHRTTLALAALASAAGTARAQYGGDPGLDPRVAAYVPPPVRVPYTCDTGSAVMRTAPSIWPGGVVPFEIDPSVSNAGVTVIAMDTWMYRSGASPNVTFIGRDPADPAHANYVRVVGIAGSVSDSQVGMTGGLQLVHQGESVNTYVMAHEFCHALGFDHEMVRPDRDTYVDVWFSRVAPENQHNFNIRAAGDWPPGTLNTGYDFDSVMHYAACAFSTCSFCDCGLSSSTCTPIVVLGSLNYLNWQCNIGQQDHLSTNDVQDMINVYGARVRPVYFVDPISTLPAGTLTHPFPRPVNAPGNFWIYGGRTSTVPPGSQFNQPAVWRKHGSGPTVITGQ